MSEVAEAGCQPGILDVREAAHYLRCSKALLDKLRCTGGGPPFSKLGRHRNASVRYRLEDLDAWLERNRHRSTSN